MIIVVEGPDNAGKTTLAMAIAKHLRAVYVKVERPKRAIDLLAYQNILETANNYSGWVVADRHVCISEPIYGTICRGGHDLSSGDIELCYDRLQAVVYCRPPTARILGTIAEREHMAGVAENAEAIVNAYDRWWTEMLSQDVHRLSWKHDFTRPCFSELIAALEKHQLSLI